MDRRQKCLAPMETESPERTSDKHHQRQSRQLLALKLGLELKRRQKCLAPMATTGAKTSPKVPGTNGDKRRKKYFKKGIEYSIMK